MTLFAASTASHLLNLVILLLGFLLMLIILIQRGKGGGLVGAFGGSGGSSPFGSKAGDTFTRITIGMAGIWVFLIMLQIKVAGWLDTPVKLNENPPAKTSSDS